MDDPAARPRPPRSVEPGGDLLHLGKHRSGQGRHPQPRTLGWMVASAIDGLRATAEDTSCRARPCRTSARSSGRWRGGRRRRGRGPHVRRRRAPAAPPRAPPTVLAMIPAALTALFATMTSPRGFASLRVAAPVPTRCRLELEHEFTTRRLPDRRGLRHDRGRHRHVSEIYQMLAFGWWFSNISLVTNKGLPSGMPTVFGLVCSHINNWKVPGDCWLSTRNGFIRDRG